MFRQTVVAAFLAACFLVSGAAAEEPACFGPKRTIAVGEFGAADVTNGAVAAEGMTALLTDALAHDCRFVVVEREAFSALETEQNLAPDKPKRLLGAGLLVRGAVTRFETAASGGGMQVGGFPGGRALGASAGVKGQRAIVAISLRVIDTATGQVIATSSAEGSATATEAEAGAIDLRTGASFRTNAFRATPLGKAAEDAVREAVEQIALGAAKTPWSAHVVETDGADVYVSAGADQNLKPGAVLSVWRVRKVLTDPVTGVVLETLMDRVGEVRIGTVREKVSIGVLTGGQTPVRGDVVRLEPAPSL